MKFYIVSHERERTIREAVPISIFMDFRDAELACVKADLNYRLSLNTYSKIDWGYFSIKEVPFETDSRANLVRLGVIKDLDASDLRYDPDPFTTPEYHDSQERLYNFRNSCIARYDQIKGLYLKYWQHQIKHVKANNARDVSGKRSVNVQSVGFDPTTFDDVIKSRIF